MQGPEDDEGWMAEGAAELDSQLQQREQELKGQSPGPGEADAADMATRIKAGITILSASPGQIVYVSEHWLGGGRPKLSQKPPDVPDLMRIWL